MLRRWVALLIGLLVGLSPAVTTSVGAASFTYDVSTVARVDVHEITAGSLRKALLGDMRGKSALPTRVDRGPSTTPIARSVATNTADDVLRLATKDSWGNLNTLDDHFARHGADFGATSVDDYARQASEFLQQPGTLTKIDADGVIRVYDPATNAFGAYNPNGTTRTFFTPKRGIDYWNDQPGVAP